MSIGNVLLSAGLGQSLIRTNVPTEEDYSTVFFFNLICSLIVYGIIYFLADRIAAFYSQPLLVDILRWYSIVVVINAFSMVQITRLTKQIDFKTQMKASFPATILSGILGVILAFRTPRWIGRHVPLKYSKNNRITTFCSLVQFLQILQVCWRMEILRRF
jgi:O-antigen/teichoic acid export membrane protein